MELKKHIRSLTQEQREELASKCKTSVGHLQNVMYGVRDCQPKLAALIETNTHGAVTRKDLLPNDWAEIWPELAATDAKGVRP